MSIRFNLKIRCDSRAAELRQRGGGLGRAQAVRVRAVGEEELVPRGDGFSATDSGWPCRQLVEVPTWRSNHGGRRTRGAATEENAGALEKPISRSLEARDGKWE
jgi:hypothetical protein